jgi:hypothetical protein
MDTKKEDISEVGFTKATNRAKKKSFETYGHDSQAKSPEAVKRAQAALGKAKRDKSGAVSRATFRANRALEALIIEGFTKRINKAKKQGLEGSTPQEKQSTRKKAKFGLSKGKRAEGHAALTAAGAMRQTGKKNTAKLFLKASKNSRAMESIASIIINAIREGREDLETDSDSISNAGGDSSTYAKIKAAKDAKLAKAVRNTGSRKDTLGKMGGFKDKKGNSPSLKTSDAVKFKKGSLKKPLPLKLKGKASPGKAVAGVRGKSVNTSRSTGEEGRKADANSGAFEKLVRGLSKSKQ